MSVARALRDFLAAHASAALVEVAEAKGSTPREKGAWMLVAPDAIFGTIGGGQLEFLAIAEARRVIEAGLTGMEGEPVTPVATEAHTAPSTTLRVVPSPPHGGGRSSLGEPPLRLSDSQRPSLLTPHEWGRINGDVVDPPLRSGGREVTAAGRPRAMEMALGTTSARSHATGRQGPREAWWRGPEGSPKAMSGDGHASPRSSTVLDIPLGPEIGQCCGGLVSLTITPADDVLREALLARAAREDAARPHVLLFGAGHVGHALARSLALLPVNVAVMETRAEALAGLPEAVAAKLLPLPEQAVREAPENSAFVILTHDHALDFLLAAESLKRGDAAYVGMIGSKTKRNTFRSWFLKEAGGTAEQFAGLVCPIGGSTVRDKRPAVIAALAAAEIVTALAARNPFSENPAPA